MQCNPEKAILDADLTRSHLRPLLRTGLQTLFPVYYGAATIACMGVRDVGAGSASGK